MKLVNGGFDSLECSLYEEALPETPVVLRKSKSADAVAEKSQPPSSIPLITIGLVDQGGI